MTPRDIPNKVKRWLRQEAGFGCCICGHPFVEYHHIDSFAISRHHDPAKMMTLCPNHHHEATVGALSITSQYDAKRRPFNIERGFADGQLKINVSELAVEVGTNYFVGPGFKLLVAGEPLLGLTSDRDGRLALSVALYDDADALLLLIENNEWVTGDPLPWDLTFAYNVISLKQKHGTISLQVDARHSPVSVRGTLHRYEQTIRLSQSTLRIDGVLEDIQFSYMGLVAIQIAVDLTPGVVKFGPYYPFKSGTIVNNPDPAERLRLSLASYQDLRRKVKYPRNASCFCGSGRRFKSCCAAD